MKFVVHNLDIIMIPYNEALIQYNKVPRRNDALGHIIGIR